MPAFPVANAGSDQNVAQASLSSGLSVNLNGTLSTWGDGAVPGSGGYKWTLVGAPAGSGAALTNDTTATPTLGGISVWGNYRIFLTVTNDIGQQSATDPLKAPNGAFVVIRVKATATNLQKPAPGERDWRDIHHEHIAESESMRLAFNARTVNGIADVATTTGPMVDYLTNGSGNATSGTYGLMHTHDGMGAATQAAFGQVKLAEPPVTASDPYVMTHAHGAYTGVIGGAHFATGWLDRVVVAPVSDDSTQIKPALTFRVIEDHEHASSAHTIDLMEFAVSMADGGDGVATTFQLAKATETNFEGTAILSNMTSIATLTVNGAGHRAASETVVLNSTTGHTVNKNEIILVNVTSPATSTDKYALGEQAVVNIRWRKKF